MVMVDDATNKLRARFAPEETTRASYDVFEGWPQQHGLMDSVYVDRDSIYRCEGVGSIAEQLAAERPRKKGAHLDQAATARLLGGGRELRRRGAQRDRQRGL